MPVTPTYPGVYIEEVPSGVHSITGVATSVGAFLDVFARGPLNTAVRIQSFADFEREFGGLDSRSEASYAIRQFFLNGGSEAWVVRVGNLVEQSPAAADLTVASVETPAAASATASIVALGLRAGRSVRGKPALDPGAWGNSIRVEVDYDVALTEPGQELTELFNLTVSEVSPGPGRLRTLRSEVYRNLTLRPGAPNNARETVNERSKLVQIHKPVDPDPPVAFDATSRAAVSGTLGKAIPASTPLPAAGKQLKVTLKDVPGEPAHPVTIRESTAKNLVEFAAVLQQSIRAAAPDEPLLAGATVKLVKANAAGDDVRLHVLAGRGGPGFEPKVKLVFSKEGGDDTATTLGFTSGSGSVAREQQFVLQGGQDGPRPSAATLRGTEATKTGLYALEDVDLFNILCVPAAADLGENEMRAVLSDCASYCGRRRAFLLVDVPKDVDEAGRMEAWMAQNDTLRSANAAVYFPRPRIADPLEGNRLRSVGASGTIAGLYARTDATRGVWKAPAGTEAQLRGVQEQGCPMTDGENGTLNPLGINCLRNFPVHGNVSWGSRTLFGADQQASEWKYVPVRRLALFLEESLFRGTKWVVFEPNDERLWAQIRLNLGAFMHDLFRKGAFQGATKREAYLVKCDNETTTQTDIDHGVVNVQVGFAPLKPAEFVVIQIQQLAGQIET